MAQSWDITELALGIEISFNIQGVLLLDKTHSLTVSFV